MKSKTDKTRGSIKRNLLIYTSLLAIVMGCALMFSAYWIALEETNEILDKQMKYAAERIASQPLTITSSHYEPQKKYHEEDLFIDIWSYQHNRKLHFQNDFIVPKLNIAGFQIYTAPSGQWHTYILPTENYQIQISQPNTVRQNLALELATSIFIPYCLLMVLLLCSLNWVIRKSLKPLYRFKHELNHRLPEDLKPIHSSRYPVELSPSIQAINQLFEQISLAQQEQKQFIADAAHELRTPITALNLKSKILLNEFPESKNIHDLDKGLNRIQHLVTQLLALAQQDAFMRSNEELSTVSINRVVHECIEDLIPLALQKNIDLGIQKQESIHLFCHPASLHSITYNLLDNAIKYTPHHGIINISMFKEAHKIHITLEDSGPGINPELHTQVLKRFYRIHQHLELGSGLGLSIVHKAIQKLHGEISFDTSPRLGGLLVKITLPDRQRNAI